MKTIILLLGIFFASLSSFAQIQIIKDYTALQCDSLINANIQNPNFVILDVRTPAEYNPQHLNGAIMRNFYDDDFTTQLSALNKDKIYVIHCRSGARSGNTLIKMESLGFKEVYNMLGGMNAWNSKSLPTTDHFAPMLMFISQQIFETDTTLVGQTDTTTVTITNRANGTLKIQNLTITQGDNFSTNIDLTKELLGAENYSFNIYYTPVSSEINQGEFYLETNDANFDILVTGIGKTITTTDYLDQIRFKISPNPANHFLKIEGISDDSKIKIINQLGQIVLSTNYSKHIDISALKTGIYWILLDDKKSTMIGKINVVK